MAIKHLITCVVAGIDYLVHPQILGSVEENVRADQIIPVLVLSERELESGPEKLWDILQYYVNHDDVCIDDFTGILIEIPASGEGSHGVRVAATDYTNFTSVYHMASKSGTLGEGRELPSGPYFLSGPNLHQAWRLYPDDLEAFNFGVIPDDILDPQSFQAVASQSSNGVSKTIPVPSRHYHHPTPERPLAGSRIALTDAFNVDGVKTTLSSRAWAELYPAATANGPCVTQLLDQGAIIVGKTKTTQFSAGTEWLDFQSPVNPRGEGYQVSSGSSAGAAASLSGYPWLDYAVGRDADGGVREPATQHGLYALRPTFGSAPLDGVKVVSPRYDTVGLFGRSLSDLSFLTENTFKASGPSGDKYSIGKIIYPTEFFPLPNPEHQSLVESFVEKLEVYLGSKKVEINLAQLWSESSHSESAANVPLQEYMKKAPFWSLCHDFYTASTQFRTDYSEKFDREPFLEKAPRLRWNIGVNVTDDERDLYLDRIATFRAWFDRQVTSSGTEGHQNTIVVLPYGDASPAYRDAPRDDPIAIEGIDASLLSPVLGTPHLVVPIAQLPYESRVSGRTEYIPVSVSIMGSRGSDLALIHTVEEALRAAGWRTEVGTGRYTFPVGNNSRGVDDGANGGGLQVAASQSTNGPGWAADEL